MSAVLEDHPDDPVMQELRAFIGALSEDEQIDLVALAWLGRGDGTIDDWDDIRGEAARAHNKRTASYLLGMPLLPNQLEDGLSQLAFRAMIDHRRRADVRSFLFGMPTCSMSVS